MVTGTFFFNLCCSVIFCTSTVVGFLAQEEIEAAVEKFLFKEKKLQNCSLLLTFSCSKVSRILMQSLSVLFSENFFLQNNHFLFARCQKKRNLILNFYSFRLKKERNRNIKAGIRFVDRKIGANDRATESICRLSFISSCCLS